MTGIEWTDETWNPTTGCDRVSPGCDNCYALTMAARLKGMGQAKYQNDGDPRTSGLGFGLTVHQDTLDVPFRWRKPRRVFVNSMSDLFHKDVPGRFIADVFGVMSLAPQHTFQVLTKRPQRMVGLVDYEPWLDDVDAARQRLGGPPQFCDWPLPNVWLGTSIESDRYAWRADHLRETPAAVRFLSLEPLLGPLPSLSLEGIDWVIVGGESGPGARPMHPDWVRDIRDRCVDAGVAFFFKQWGAWVPTDGSGGDFPVIGRGGVGPIMATPGTSQLEPYVWGWKGGKTATGRELDGRTWDEMPALGVSDSENTQ